MHKLFEDRLCSGCTHLVLKGVACDWRPGECPYLQAEKKAVVSGKTTCTFMPITPLHHEFDAVRSID